MSSTPITHNELLKRGWDYDSIRDSFGIGECEFVLRCASSELPHEFEGGRWYLEFFSAVIYMSTIEELYAHLHYFGLIEPEPISDSQLDESHWDYTRPYDITSHPVWGWAKEGDKFALFYDVDSGIASLVDKDTDKRVLVNSVSTIHELNTISGFLNCFGEEEIIASQKRISKRKPVATPPNGGEGGTHA